MSISQKQYCVSKEICHSIMVSVLASNFVLLELSLVDCNALVSELQRLHLIYIAVFFPGLVESFSTQLKCLYLIVISLCQSTGEQFKHLNLP